MILFQYLGSARTHTHTHTHTDTQRQHKTKCSFTRYCFACCWYCPLLNHGLLQFHFVVGARSSINDGYLEMRLCKCFFLPLFGARCLRSGACSHKGYDGKIGPILLQLSKEWIGDSDVSHIQHGACAYLMSAGTPLCKYRKSRKSGCALTCSKEVSTTCEDRSLQLGAYMSKGSFNDL